MQNLFLWVREQTCVRVVWCVCCLGGLLSVWLVQECARVFECGVVFVIFFGGGDFFEGFLLGRSVLASHPMYQVCKIRALIFKKPHGKALILLSFSFFSE